MENEQIVTILVTHRFRQKALVDGMDQATALLAAEDIVKANRREIESCAVPEMTIVSILDTYYHSLSLSVKSGGPGFDAKQLDLKKFQHNLTGHIEQQRNRFAKGKWFYPRTLTEYIQYRVVLECRTFSKQNSGSIGLGSSVVSEMINLVKPMMVKRYELNSADFSGPII